MTAGPACTNLVHLEGSASQMAQALRDGTTTSSMLTETALSRIRDLDGSINAFVQVDEPGARQAAEAADKELRAGVDRGPLHGVPYALKDIYDAQGLMTTCGSRLHGGAPAVKDSAVAARARAGGAVLIGKLATYEYALGGPSFDGPVPPTRNPWNTDHIPGGSSSGSGAAIAASFVPVAIGSCTTGSIRGPASWCGAVGLKPTFGRVSRRGVFPLAPSLDHCGPLTRSVRDAAMSLQVMAGHDPCDPTSADAPVPDYVETLETSVAGLRVGVPRSWFETANVLDAEAQAGIDKALNVLEQSGCEIRDVALPDAALFLACGRVIMSAESFAIHRQNLVDRLADYGEIAARRFTAGVTLSARDYLDALALKADLSAAVDRVFDDVSIILTAISLATAPRLESSGPPKVWPLQASTFNVTGHPAIAVPVGLARNGLPLSVQIAGRYFAEATVLQTARTIERSTGWASIALPLSGERSSTPKQRAGEIH